MKLHFFELAGTVPLWNCPVTPEGARLLLSHQQSSDSCCLDHSDRSVALNCVDGRYGDTYPSTTPSTLRCCVSRPGTDTVIENTSPNLSEARNRKQAFKVIHLSKRTAFTHSLQLETIRSTLMSYGGRQESRSKHSLKYNVISSVGWIAWAVLAIIGFLTGWYFVARYLLLMPVTRLVVHYMYVRM